MAVEEVTVAEVVDAEAVGFQVGVGVVEDRIVEAVLIILKPLHAMKSTQTIVAANITKIVVENNDMNQIVVMIIAAAAHSVLIATTKPVTTIVQEVPPSRNVDLRGFKTGVNLTADLQIIQLALGITPVVVAEEAMTTTVTVVQPKKATTAIHHTTTHRRPPPTDKSTLDPINLNRNRSSTNVNRIVGVGARIADTLPIMECNNSSTPNPMTTTQCLPKATLSRVIINSSNANMETSKVVKIIMTTWVTEIQVNDLPTTSLTFQTILLSIVAVVTLPTNNSNKIPVNFNATSMATKATTHHSLLFLPAPNQMPEVVEVVVLVMVELVDEVVIKARVITVVEEMHNNKAILTAVLTIGTSNKMSTYILCQSVCLSKDVFCFSKTWPAG